MRGRWKVIVGMVSCMLLFGGCVAQESVAENVEDDKTNREKIVLWSYYETQQQRAGMDYLVREFNASQDVYEATWEYKGPSAEFKKQLSIGVAEEKLPDMVIIDNPDMQRYVKLGIFEDITEYVEENYSWNDFYPEVISSVQYDGRDYGVPFCCNNVGLIYNKEMLEAAGVTPPATWEEFYQAAEMLTTEDTYGFVISAIMEEQSAFQVLPWILSTGETMEDLGGEGSVKAFELFRKMTEEGLMPSECINWSQVDLARQFIDGKCAMMENGPWVLPILEEADMSYGIVKLPMEQVGAVVAGGENLAVVKGKNVEGAKAFFDFYYSDAVMLKTNEMMYSLPPVKELAQQLGEKEQAYQVFVEQMDSCITRSAYSYWPDLTSLLSGSLYGVITENMTPMEAADHIGREN